MFSVFSDKNIYIIVDRHFGNQQLKSNYNVTVISIPLTDLLKYAECHLQAETSRGKVDFITSLYILEHKKVYCTDKSKTGNVFFLLSLFWLFGRCYFIFFWKGSTFYDFLPHSETYEEYLLLVSILRILINPRSFLGMYSLEQVIHFYSIYR